MSSLRELILDALHGAQPCPDGPPGGACLSCLSVAVEKALQLGAPA